ncbi:MAG TPA: nuclear transport factor 2 family protein, partial [Acidimicrobiales bacterium]|nr:nuclear transport factor 2 family protein [Acidimicrobiales bacterium]
MGVDVDPKTLEIAADASAHAYRQATAHIGEEIKARDPRNLTALIDTLAPEGPYAYTIMPRIGADGSVTLPVLTTREEIAEAYAFIRGMSDLHEVVGLTEVVGSWYLFQDSLTVGGPSGTDVRNHRQTLGLFPSGREHGITGELVWLRVPTAQLGAPDDPEVEAGDELHARKHTFDRFQQHLAGLRANDVEAVLEPIHDGAASAVRDYVAGTGALVELSGKDAHRSWYRDLFAAYDIRSVQVLHVVTDTWYVFAELRITAARRDSGDVVAFHTAEFHVRARDGRFIARIGHG